MIKKKKRKPEQKLNSSTGEITYKPSVFLKSLNTNGVFTEDTLSKAGKDGKRKEVVNYNGCTLVNTITGGIISDDVSPRFEGWEYADFKKQFDYDQTIRWIEPMGAQEPEEYEYERNDIAELKRDGHRALLYITEIANRAFSRYPSKVTGWFTENSDRIPHIRDLKLPTEFIGTVLDGEMDYGKDSRNVQSVMGSLPERAIQHQFQHGFIPFYVFDIPYYKGINIQNMPLWKRKVYAAEIVHHINHDPNGPNFQLIQLNKMYVTKYEKDALTHLWSQYIRGRGMSTDLIDYLQKHIEVVPSYLQLFDKFVLEEKEGLIVKDMDGVYQQQKSKYQLKLKAKSTWDVVFMGLTAPEREYTGKKIAEGKMHEWEYWYNTFFDEIVIGAPGTPDEVLRMTEGGECIPVTKPFAMGWCGGIRCGVYKEIDNERWEGIEGEYGINIEQAEDENIIIYRDGKGYELTEVCVVKGLTEETMIDLKEKHDDYYWEKRVLEVTANGMQDYTTGSLRHPRFLQWRDDKPFDACTFEDHIRKREK